MKVSTNKRKASQRSDEKKGMESEERCENTSANVKNNAGDKRKQYMCQICDKQFKMHHHHKNHMRVHTGERPYECNICGHKCKQNQQLRTHMKVHSGEKPHKCKFCDYECSQKGTLNNHMKTHTGVKPFKCMFCDYSCTQKQHLQSHLKVHTGEKPFGCYICNHRTNRKEALKLHIKNHSKRTPVTCEYCDLQFYSKRKLKRHLDVIHCDERNVKSHQKREEPKIKKQRKPRLRKPVEVVEKLESRINSDKKDEGTLVDCFENFSSKNEGVEERPENVEASDSFGSQVPSLEGHKRNLESTEETDDEVFACKICEEEFLDEDKMRDHLRSHIADVLNLKTPKSFESAVYSCLSKRRNESQYRDFDINKDTFTCQHEDIEPLSGDLMFYHQSMKEDHCSSDETGEFKYSNNARSSTPKTHSSRLEQSSREVFACNLCEEEFSDEDRLPSHFEAHKRESRNKTTLYTCQFCNKKFLHKSHCQDHIRSHMNEKLYECYFCDYKSSRKENLPIHVRIHFEKESYECPNCSYNCLHKKQFEDHLKSHQSDNYFNSNVISFQDELSIKEEYLEEILFECELCDMEFSCEQQFHDHVTVHKHEKSSKCGKCDSSSSMV